MTEDTFTRTEADAGRYERDRAEAAGEFDGDRPSMSELDEFEWCTDECPEDCQADHRGEQ